MNLPVMQETQETRVLALGGEDPLKEEMATYSSILAWKILWTEEPGELWSIGSQRVKTQLNMHMHELIRDHMYSYSLFYSLKF